MRVRAQLQSPGWGAAALPSSFFTMSNSPLRGICRATHLVPAPHLCVEGLSFLFVSTASPLPSPTIRRACARNLGRHQFRPRNEGAGGAPGGVTAVVALVRSRHSRLRGVLVPRNRDARLSALHRGAVGPGPLSRSGIAAGSGAMGCSRQALSCLTAEPGFSYPRVTSRGRRHSPLRLLDRLRKTPLMSEDGESSIIYSLRSQQTKLVS